jgi:hypothetical protein
MITEGNAAYPVVYNKPMQIFKKWPFGAFFSKFELAGSGMGQPAADYNGCLACFKLLSAAGCHTRPDHSAK